MGLLNGPVYWRPALTQGMVFLSLGDRIVALDRDTGAGRWQRSLTDPGRLALGLASDGVMTLAVTTADGGVLALRSETGALRWGMHFTVAALMAPSVTVSDHLAYVALPSIEGSQVAALDLATGQERWRQAIAPHAVEPVVTSGSRADRRTSGRGLASPGPRRSHWGAAVAGTADRHVPPGVPGCRRVGRLRRGRRRRRSPSGRPGTPNRALEASIFGRRASTRFRRPDHPAVVGLRVFVTADGHGFVSFDPCTGQVQSRERRPWRPPFGGHAWRRSIPSPALGRQGW